MDQFKQKVFSPIGGQEGNAIVEFALVLPLLALLVIGTVEYTSFFRLKEFQTLITREAGTIAYRYCFERGSRVCSVDDLYGEEGVDTNTRIETCLEEYADIIDTYVSNIFPNSALTLSFWDFNPVTNTVSLMANTTRQDSTRVPTRSHYVNNFQQLRTDFEGMLREHENVVIAESFLRFPFTFIEFFQPGIDLYHVSAY